MADNPYQPPTADNHGSSKPPGAKFANCPRCQHSGAKRVGFTLWGGAFGPWLFTHVKCDKCGATFNGKTGQSNTTAILIYIGVSFALAIVIFFGIVCSGAGSR